MLFLLTVVFVSCLLLVCLSVVFLCVFVLRCLLLC